MNFIKYYDLYKFLSLSGRYLNENAFLKALEKFFNYKTVLGYSVEKRPISLLKIGKGKTKILIWSQMHGNETTTTKAIFDFINTILNEKQLLEWHSIFTWYIIPVLNPDGAVRYTRENANGVDLNRDFINLSQPESVALMNLFDQIKPDFCFNMHDQRTIFGVGHTKNPATISFLAPSYNEQKDYNEIRLKAVNLVASCANYLSQIIPNQIGRFDDAFNLNCAGDRFQEKGVPTILIEAGHYQNDYEREETRRFVYLSLLQAMKAICENDIVDNKLTYYLNISQNKVSFYDIIYKNIKIYYDNSELITNFAVQFVEEVKDGNWKKTGKIVAIGNLDGFYGHQEFIFSNDLFTDGVSNYPTINNLANFQIGDYKFCNGEVEIK